MALLAQFSRPLHRASALILALVFALMYTMFAYANVPITKLSTDPFTNSSSQHQTEVEPDSFAFGNTIVAVVQVGRFFDGGASDIGWATSTNNGTSWTNGFLPGITKYQGSGPYDRVSDPAVAYDRRHNVWLISSLPILENPSVTGAGVLVSRSTSGGLTWNSPVTVASQSGADKEWVVCDNSTSSSRYGNCYVEWDDNANGNLIQMSTSSDGGLTWSPPQTTANNATGIGGQPLVQPNGTVIVPIDNAFETALLAFTSTSSGGWSSTVTITKIRAHTEAGSLRSGPLPSAEIDSTGKVYVVWQDCRFIRLCRANDIVMTTSTNGTTWSSVTRIPIDATNSGVDHFIPGLGVDPATGGSGAHLGLAYYYYPVSKCSSSTCQLDVGYIASSNGGSSWSAQPTQLAGPMPLSWLANTNQGRMVGDYISTSFSGGNAHPVFVVANAPSGTVFDEAMYTPTTGLHGPIGATVSAGADQPVPDLGSDRVIPSGPLTQH